MNAKLPAVRAVLRHGDRYLLVQHNNILPETIGKWGIPGGRIDPEDIDHVATLRREIHEEFQVAIAVIGFIGTYTYRERAHHVYLAVPEHTNFQVDKSEILALTWLTLPEVATWHQAGRLHTGFELDAIRRGETLFPISHFSE